MLAWLQLHRRRGACRRIPSICCSLRSFARDAGRKPSKMQRVGAEIEKIVRGELDRMAR